MSGNGFPNPTWRFRGRSSAIVVESGDIETSDSWVKIVTTGTQADFYTSPDGITWTWRYQSANAAFTFTGPPKLAFPGGYSSGTAANFWIDNFSAQ
jgi:cation diffusion facilitator CzcD-associated flavoprotein CzcO